MQNKIAENALKQRLATISNTNPSDWFLVSRARHGMTVVLGAVANYSNKGEVVTQAFTCITAVNPILATGHKPIYCDITEYNLSLDSAKLAKTISPKTRAVIAQHTFGCTSDLQSIASLLHQKAPSALLLEDSAHCLGMLAKSGGKVIADVSFHSFGAEKLLPTSFGGAVWVNPAMKNVELRAKIISQLSQLPRMSLASQFQTWLYKPLNSTLNRLPNQLSQPLRKIGTTLKILVTPVMPAELLGVNFDQPARLTNLVTRQLLRNIENYSRICEHRKTISQIYARGLRRKGAVIPGAVAKQNLPFVRFPVILASAESNELFTRLKINRMNPGKWYRPLLFPGTSNPALYGYNSKSSPIAEDVSARIINLPTGLGITVKRAKEILDEVNR